MRSTPSSARASRAHPLAACLAAALGLGTTCALAGQTRATPLASHLDRPGIAGRVAGDAAPVDSRAAASKRSRRASPASIVVDNCLDSGSGSLRAAVAGAADGATIDLTQLSCSVISLTTRIDTANDLSLIGPGSAALAIDGDRLDRVFNHSGDGELELQGMTLQNGYGFLGGGCMYATGSVALDDVVVSGCKVIGIAGSSTYFGGGIAVIGNLALTDSRIVGNEVYSSLGGAEGGGVYASGNLIITSSTISGNSVTSASSAGFANGGGARVGGGVAATFATIADNTASALAAPFGTAGGLISAGSNDIEFSTISGNMAGSIGGLSVHAGAPAASFIVDSTISSNQALTGTIGGIYSDTALTLLNSTIAFNTEAISLGAGLFQTGFVADLESSILANNGGGSSPTDIGEGPGTAIGGANDLIMTTGSVTPPAGTLHSDPHLLPLGNNGGITLTHALGAGSAAIDAGSNILGLADDQRGSPFARVSGAAADIGAFELDRDFIFADGFD